MVVEVDTRKKLSPFFEYNLFQEADDSKPSNMKVIDLKLSDKRRRDYTKDSEITMDDDEEVDTPEEPITDEEDYSDTDIPEDSETPEDNEDYTTDADNPPEEGGNEETPDEPITDNEDYTADADNPPEDGGNEGEAETPEEGGNEETPDEPITDNEDYTADADNPPEDGGNEGEAETTDSETPDQGEDQSGEGQDDKVEQMYKYNLYQKFKNVYTSLDEYIEEINTITSDDGELNREYKELSIKLIKIKELMKDYMIMKFAKSSFTKSMFFYQRIMTSINLILQTLKKIRLSEIKSKT